MKILAINFLLLVAFPLMAQKYKSETGTITFFSEAAVENIAATNEKSVSIFNAETGDIAFLVTIADFEFDKSLMKEHFNEKYMESDKFPRATFKGKITGYDLTVNSEQPVVAKGELTIHGETQQVSQAGTMQIQSGAVVMKSDFIVELADYKIKIPKLLWQNIAERVEVKTTFTFKMI